MTAGVVVPAALADAATGARLAVPAVLAAAAVAVLLLPRTGSLRARNLLGEGRAVARGARGRGLAAGGLAAGAARRLRRLPPGVRALAPSGLAMAVLVPIAGLVVALLGGLGVRAVLRWRVGRRRATARRVERVRAVEACSALSAELRAGRSPAQALAVAAELACGPSRGALGAAAAAAGMGGDVAGALVARRRSPGSARPGAPGSGCPPPGCPPPDSLPPGSGPPGRRASGSSRTDGETETAVPEVLRALAACWTVCATSGSGLATAVERLEQALRAEQEQRRAVQAELAGPRATAGMLAVLPLAGLVLAAGLGADPIQVLLHTPVGLTCLVLGLALDALGLAWTGRLVAQAGGAD